EHEPRLRREPCERGFEVEAGGDRSLAGRDGLEVARLRRRRLAPALSPHVDADVAEHAVQPGRARPLAPILGRLSKDAQERELNAVLSVGFVPEDAQRDAEEASI